MEFIKSIIDILLHVDRHLLELSRDYGVWMYAILFLIVFCETGLVVTPFLPGDSLLFAVGSLAAIGVLDFSAVVVLLIIAAIAGDTANYWAGARVGPTVFQQTSRFFKKEYLDRTHAFYEKHGGKTIIIARFVPIMRTFAPFVAGIGAMTYRTFIVYNIVGGVAWVVSFTLLGFFFGNLPVVKQNFTLVIGAIILISLLPGFIEFLRQRNQSKRSV